ncbi:MAG: Na+/H+ antiporter subunit G [Acidimicrobiaceae bacterium]|nr:Na+/H+ antiporter subunit G [Acidimicrobiaceae bacterium]
MDQVWDVVGGVSMIIGALLVLLAGIGAVRFNDTYARMHAAAKAPALGILMMGVGVAMTLRTTPAVIEALLIVALQLIAGTVGTHIMGRSVYYCIRPPLTAVDELDRDLETEATADAESDAGSDAG